MSRLPSHQTILAGITVVALLLWPHAGFGQTSVLTYHYDNARTGQNTDETILSPANVRVRDRFARLFTIRFHDVDAPGEMDGDVFAQSLYVPNLTMGSHTPQAGTKHNVIFVVTEGDMVYAFDADNRDGPNASPLWKANLLDIARGAAAGAIPIPRGEADTCGNIVPQIGITSTPVIDPSSGTLYVTAKTKETVGGVAHYFLRLHALAITNGAERPNSPVVMGDTTVGGAGGFTNNTNISVPGTGDGSTNVKFNVLRENQRVGLLLSNGVVYIATGSHCDSTPFHGWIAAYNAQTLAQVAVFCTTPNGSAGGIWMEGAGLAADSNGNLFVATGNGDFDATLDAQGFPSNHDFGDSIVKLDPNLHVLDYFSPFNRIQMEQPPDDNDLGSGGVLLIPDQPGSHPHLLVQAGKLATVYVVDRDNMGHYCSSCTNNTNIVQELVKGVANTPVPIYWNGSVYFHADVDVLRAYAVNNGLLTSPRQATEPVYSGLIVISSNGSHDGIVWSLKSDGAEFPTPASAVLYAYDAATLSKLYASDRKIEDNPGQAVTVATPIVANGKVYVGSRTQLSVFGLDTVRIQVTDVQHRGANWCGTISAVDTATRRQVPGTVYLGGNAIGPTNQQLCFRPPSCRTVPCVATATIEFASFPTKQIRIRIR